MISMGRMTRPDGLLIREGHVYEYGGERAVIRRVEVKRVDGRVVSEHVWGRVGKDRAIRALVISEIGKEICT
jgi:hypothetical protein